MIWIVRINIRSLMWMLHYKSLTWDWIWNKFEFDRGENVELVSLKEEEKDMKNTIIGDELSTVFRWITLMIKPKLFTHGSFGHHYLETIKSSVAPPILDWQNKLGFCLNQGWGAFRILNFWSIFPKHNLPWTVHKCDETQTRRSYLFII